MELNIEDLGNVGIVVEDWNINNSYSPRTITTDYTSWITYISRKRVPAGIELTNENYWKPIFRLDKTLAFNYETFKKTMTDKMDNLKYLVDSFLENAKEDSVALANEFGNSKVVGVNQYTLTTAVNELYGILEDITGNSYQGIDMEVSPKYYVGEEGATVKVTATTVLTNGVFEHIEIYFNGSLVAESDNTDYFEYDGEITETTVVKCVAKIMGIEYTKQDVITHHASFWLGAGNTYSSIMDEAHVIPITNGMRGAYPVTVNQGNHIFVIVGESLADAFIRADMNSIEIPFTESTVTVDGNNYKVFTSVNTYVAGTYNVDING